LGAGGLFWTAGSQQLACSHLSAVGLKKDGVEDKSLTWKTNHDSFFFKPSDPGRWEDDTNNSRAQVVGKVPRTEDTTGPQFFAVRHLG